MFAAMVYGETLLRVKETRTVALKIKIPDGMLRAAKSAGISQDHPECVRYQLEAALCWLTENPVVPTSEQMDELFEQHSWLDKDSVRFGAREWQSRMFLDPDPSEGFHEMKEAIDVRYRGKTITRAEADELMGMINRCVPPVPKADQKVPEAIKSFTWGDFERNCGVPEFVGGGIAVIDTHNAQVREAFRRGQNSVSKT
jgi:hypothetical protein